jgi:hypothetical protein
MTQLPDYGRSWTYRASSDSGTELETIKLGDNAEAEEWVLGVAKAHRLRIVVLDRHTNGVWEPIGKFGPMTAVSE